jgi:tetratricopeptide (TPR) repeat protein
MGYVAQIADDLTAARAICPTYGPTHALEGELRLFVLGDERGADLIRNASKLAAFDPYTCLVAGQLAARDGSLDEAQVLLDRAVALDAGLFPAVVDIYLKLNRPAWARSLAGERHTRLQQLAQMCAAMEQYQELSNEILADAERVIRARIDADTANGRELATVARAEFEAGQFDTSVSLYRRALGRDYRQIEWRLQLARGLVKLDRIEDAMHELRICLRLRPGYGPAENLLESLGKLPAGK